MPRVLSEQEFEALKAKVLAAAPDLKNEAEFTRWVGPAMAQAIGEAENSAAPVEGSALRRFVGGAAQNLNPITALQGLYGAVRHPLDTGGALLQTQLAELQKAGQDFKAGRYSEMVGHGAAGALPLIGPAAAAAGEGIAAGDVAGGLGQGAGLVAPFAAGTVARGVKAGTKAVVQGARAVPKGAAALDALAEAADAAATNRIVDVAAPKVGPNKLRLNQRMATVAPEIARDPDLAALSRSGLQSKVAAKLEEATAALDDAADTRLVSQQVKTAPVLQALDEKIGKLTVQPVEASRRVPQVTGEAVREVPVNPTRHYALQWMKDEMESFPFVKRTWNEAPRKSGNAAGGDFDIVAGAGGAPIYQAILGKSSEFAHATRGEVTQAIQNVMSGKTTGKLEQLVIGVADDLAAGGKTQRVMQTPGPIPEQAPSTHVRTVSGDEAGAMPAVAGRPIGRAVEPGPNEIQLQTLRRIRSEVARLGSVAPYESVRKIRQAWDQVARIKYSPSMTTDFLAKQGEANAAMQGTGVLRDALAAVDPVTAKANANYSLYKTAHDVLQATEEVERARPTVGRTLMARGLGAATGASSGGAGMAIGAIVGPLVERVAASTAPTMKLAVARKLATVADLLRAGKVAEAETLARQTARTLPTLIRGSAVPAGRLQDATLLPMAAEDQRDRPPAIGQR